MNIIVRQIRGGFLARFNAGKMSFGPLGKSKAEAIGNLILASPRRAGITHIQWDMQDEWTRRYVEGRCNRRRMPRPRIDVRKLPKVSRARAHRLRFHELRIPMFLSNALECLGDNGEPVTLGRISKFTRAQLIERGCTLFPFGPRRLALLEQLLAHYGLALKQ